MKYVFVLHDYLYCRKNNAYILSLNAFSINAFFHSNSSHFFLSFTLSLFFSLPLTIFLPPTYSHVFLLHTVSYNTLSVFLSVTSTLSGIHAFCVSQLYSYPSLIQSSFHLSFCLCLMFARIYPDAL